MVRAPTGENGNLVMSSNEAQEQDSNIDGVASRLNSNGAAVSEPQETMQPRRKRKKGPSGVTQEQLFEGGNAGTIISRPQEAEQPKRKRTKGSTMKASNTIREQAVSPPQETIHPSQTAINSNIGTAVSQPDNDNPSISQPQEPEPPSNRKRPTTRSSNTTRKLKGNAGVAAPQPNNDRDGATASQSWETEQLNGKRKRGREKSSNATQEQPSKKRKRASATKPPDAMREQIDNATPAAPQPNNNIAIISQPRQKHKKANHSNVTRDSDNEGAIETAPPPHQAAVPNNTNIGRDEELLQLRAQVHKLASINKALVASQNPEATLIPRPVKGSAGQEWNMQERMGLEDNPKLYLSIRGTIRDLIVKSGIDHQVPWARQDPQLKADIIAVARERQLYLKRFENNWATYDLIRLALKNKRMYGRQKAKKDDKNSKGGRSGESNKCGERGESGESGESSDSDESSMDGADGSQ